MWLVASACALATGETIDAVVTPDVPIGVVYAALLWAGTYWAYRSRGWGAPALLGGLAWIEFLMVVSVYGHDKDPSPTWKLTILAALTLLVILTSVATILHIVRQRRHVEEDDLRDAA